MPNVELPAQRAGLPEKEVSFILCPLTPPIPLWRDGARLGQSSNFKLNPKVKNKKFSILEFDLNLTFGL
jgi:hypothetical protein